jgi:outer membrane protein assembly factor BamD
MRPFRAIVALHAPMHRLLHQRTRRRLSDGIPRSGTSAGALRVVTVRVAELRIGLLAGIVALSACGGSGFRVDRFVGQTGELFLAGVRELNLKHWDNAVLAFEKLATDLPARDTLLPRTQYFLGKARSGNLEHLLAAQAFNKVAENYPEDSLADDAMFASAREYEALWRSPELDSQYGTTAQATFRTLVAVYPDSPRRKDAEREILALDEMFAAKEYLAGYYYFRRKAYDPAILYFKTVVNSYPTSSKARDAYLRMVESYRVIHYKEEAAEACAAVRKQFGTDVEVQRACPPAAAAHDSTAAPGTVIPAAIPPPRKP